MSRPVTLALAFAAAPLIGLVGMLCTDGWLDWAFLAVALAPVGLASSAYLRAVRNK